MFLSSLPLCRARVVTRLTLASESQFQRKLNLAPLRSDLEVGSFELQLAKRRAPIAQKTDGARRSILIRLVGVARALDQTKTTALRSALTHSLQPREA